MINAINKAKTRRNVDLSMSIHSNRGSRYISKVYRWIFEYLEAFTTLNEFTVTVTLYLQMILKSYMRKLWRVYCF